MLAHLLDVDTIMSTGYFIATITLLIYIYEIRRQISLLLTIVTKSTPYQSCSFEKFQDILLMVCVKSFYNNMKIAAEVKRVNAALISILLPGFVKQIVPGMLLVV